MKCSIIGKDPLLFSWRADLEDEKCLNLLAKLDQAIDEAIQEGVTHFITGNSPGLEIWSAEIILKKKRECPPRYHSRDSCTF